MNKDIAIIAEYRRKLTWNIKKLDKSLDIWYNEELYGDELSILAEKIMKYEKAITEYKRKIVWRSKRLGIVK